MDPKAIEKAKRRLETAERSLAKLDSPANYAEFQIAWTDFLLALGGIHTALEKGSKTSPASRNWYGAKKHARRTDPLLSYLHQARNADEHGLAPISKFEPPRVELVDGTGDPTAVENVTVSANEVIIDLTPGKPMPLINIYPPGAFLSTVRDDRYGDSFDPPKQHLGVRLENDYPLTVAKQGFSYFKSLVAEAEGLPPMAA